MTAGKVSQAARQLRAWALQREVRVDDMYIIQFLCLMHAVHEACGVDREGASELRSCLKIEVDVLGTRP